MVMKVVYKKLGKQRAWGQAHVDSNTIEIDPRLRARKKMQILIHEAMHILNPDWSETKVIEQSTRMAKMLWSQHYREVDLKTNMKTY
jgi:hypothetical protein